MNYLNHKSNHFKNINIRVAVILRIRKYLLVFLLLNFGCRYNIFSQNIITSFSENFSIGNGNNNYGYFFSNIKSLAIDDSSNIFVIDGKGEEFIKFSKDGKIKKVIGTKGTGPGDFKSARIIKIDSKNNKYVYDVKNKRISKFDPNNYFVRSFTLYSKVVDFKCYGNSFLILTSELKKEKGKYFYLESLCLYNKYFEFQKKIDSLRINNITSIKIGEMVTHSLGPFSERLLWEVDEELNIYVIHPSDNFITKYDYNFKKIITKKIFSKKNRVKQKDIENYFNNITANDKILKRIRNQTKFPSYKPSFTDVLMNNGYLYLKNSIIDEQQIKITVLNNSCEVIKKISWNKANAFNCSVFSKNRILFVDFTSEGFPYISICKLNRVF